MTQPAPASPCCPKCGSSRVTLCGQSLDYAPEERPGQPLHERELHAFAYQCECGLAFTQTVTGEDLPPDS